MIITMKNMFCFNVLFLFFALSCWNIVKHIHNELVFWLRTNVTNSSAFKATFVIENWFTNQKLFIHRAKNKTRKIREKKKFLNMNMFNELVRSFSMNRKFIIIKQMIEFKNCKFRWMLNGCSLMDNAHRGNLHHRMFNQLQCNGRHNESSYHRCADGVEYGQVRWKQTASTTHQANSFVLKCFCFSFASFQEPSQYFRNRKLMANVSEPFVSSSLCFPFLY